MKSVEASAEIAADPAAVWAVLTDAAALLSADLGIVELQGRIGAGERLRLRSQVAPKQVFRLRVTVFEPARRMVWSGGMPFGLFTGQRSFDLSPRGAGTHLQVREVFTGPLSGMIWNSMPDLQPSFDRFIAGVTEMAERSAP